MRIRTRLLGGLLALLCTALLLAATPASARAADFRVLAFYSGTWDAAHISFVHEANEWFPQTGAEHGFSYEATTDWNRLASLDPASYEVVLFLDDVPQSADQRAGFERYMNAGGAWFGFHVSAFTTDPGSWDWYHNQFLGTGAFATNTWGPTTAVMRVEDQAHPATQGLGETFTSSVSEWYSWEHDLRQNPDIDILASVDPSSFPLGTDPNQSWYDGYYPLLWTNVNYRMLYANFGHNAMDYENNVPLSSTFDSETQNTFIINGLRWLGTQS